LLYFVVYYHLWSEVLFLGLTIRDFGGILFDVPHIILLLLNYPLFTISWPQSISASRFPPNFIPNPPIDSESIYVFLSKADFFTKLGGRIGLVYFGFIPDILFTPVIVYFPIPSDMFRGYFVYVFVENGSKAWFNAFFLSISSIYSLFLINFTSVVFFFTGLFTFIPKAVQYPGHITSLSISQQYCLLWTIDTRH
jgi:hypothetical protein